MSSSTDFKIVFVGAAGVGKTSLINRYCMNTFSEDTMATIGVSFFSRGVDVGNIKITLMIWDTAGEERFRSVAPSLLRGADGIVIVYDVTRPSSLSEIDFYFKMFLEMVHVNHSRPPVLLLGNKCDVDVDSGIEAHIDCYEVQNWLQRRNVTMTAEVSAKTGENVEEAMFKLAECVATNYADRTPRNGTTLTLQGAPKKRKCC